VSALEAVTIERRGRLRRRSPTLFVSQRLSVKPFSFIHWSSRNFVM
jgi:hypothetical protein